MMTQLDGLELPGRAWEQAVLPARVRDYSPAMLDMLCLTGEVGWARLSSGPTQVVGATPIALFLREHAEHWLELRNRPGRPQGGSFRTAGGPTGAAVDPTDPPRRRPRLPPRTRRLVRARHRVRRGAVRCGAARSASRDGV